MLKVHEAVRIILRVQLLLLLCHVPPPCDHSTSHIEGAIGFVGVAVFVFVNIRPQIRMFKPLIRLIRPLIRLIRPLLRLIRPLIKLIRPQIKLIRTQIRPLLS